MTSASSPSNSAFLRLLTTDDLSSVYSGRDGRCCCGCAGKHYDAPNGVMFRKALRIVRESFNTEVQVGLGSSDGYVAATVGDRVYICYLKEGVHERILATLDQKNRAERTEAEWYEEIALGGAS